MSASSNDKELKPLMVAGSAATGNGAVGAAALVDEKYAAKTPFNVKKWAAIFVGLAVVLYMVSGRTAGGTADSNSSNDSAASSHKHGEIHQTIHNRTHGNGMVAEVPVSDSSAGTTPSSPKANADKPQPASKTKKGKKGKNTLDFVAMSQSFETARQAMMSMLRSKYGKYTDPIFLRADGTNYGRSIFTSGNTSSTISWARFQRKLMIKLLQTNDNQKFMIPFVWGSGGHSAAASHGNFYNESYSAFLEQAAHDVFAAVNINFTVRKYAMGGTAAAPEVSLCVKEIYGKDIDVLLWDFGMTDGNDIWKQVFYHWRGAILKNVKPVLMVYHTGDGFLKERQKATTAFEDLGLSAMISSEKVLDEVTKAIPDTFGLTEAEIQAMPPYVKAFKCDGKIEVGDPYCAAEKYDVSVCPERKGRVSWHPGWKTMAVHGYLVALFVCDVLEDALKELVAQQEAGADQATLLRRLQSDEEADYDMFTKAPVPAHLFVGVLPPSGEDGFDLDLFVKGHNFCHTAKLPAEIRYKGILTESDKIGFFTYDTGIGLNEAKTGDNTGDLMRLTYTEDDVRTCPGRIEVVDYKNYFFVGVAENWKRLTVPNNAAFQEYSVGQPLRGHVAICFAICDWGNCPNGSVERDTFAQGGFEIKINDVPVTDLFTFLECNIARNADGYNWKPNNDGRFDVSVRVNPAAQKGAFLQISAVVVW